MQDQAHPTASEKSQAAWLRRTAIILVLFELVALAIAALYMYYSGSMSWFPLAFGIIFGVGVAVFGVTMTFAALIHFSKSRGRGRS